MVSQWQKDYEEEAKNLIKNSMNEYKEGIKKVRIIEEGLCEVGMHTTQNKIGFCKRCKRSFCKEHGDIDENVCIECQERNF